MPPNIAKSVLYTSILLPLEPPKNELIRELKQLVNDFNKIQNSISTGKFTWE